MDELAHPELTPHAAVNTPESELARVRQQLQHYQDVEAQRQQHYQDVEAQRQHQSSYMTATSTMGPVNLFWFAETGGGICVSDSLMPFTIMDAETCERHQAEEKTAREALARALTLLEDKIGPQALAKIQAGGAFQIRSHQWPNVIYLVPRDPNSMVKVLANGALVTEVCIVSRDNSLPWPDIMFHRITAIQADESILFATGVVHPKHLQSRFNKILRCFR